MQPDVRQPLVIGNWKMHGTIVESIKRITALKYLLAEVSQVEVGIAPPFTALNSVAVALADTRLALVGQNMYWEDEGAFTGEVSGPFLKDVGCDFVLLGHSERRQHFGETDAMVSQKVQAALKSDLIPVVCVGESLTAREKGQTLQVVETMMKAALSEIAMRDFEKLVIAYEPVWAIGTGVNATPAQAGEVHHFIRTWLTKYYDAPTANKVRILYGGSVSPQNAPLLMKETHVDGLLVGGASLNAEDFAKIVKFEEGMN